MPTMVKDKNAREKEPEARWHSGRHVGRILSGPPEVRTGGFQPAKTDTPHVGARRRGRWWSTLRDGESDREVKPQPDEVAEGMNRGAARELVGNG